MYVSARVAALLASEFILIYACYLAATFAWLRADAPVFLIDDRGMAANPDRGVLSGVSIYFLDLYSNLGICSRELLQKVGVVVGTAFLTEAMLGYLKLLQLVVPAGPMIAGSALNLGALMAWRFFFSRVLLSKMRPSALSFWGFSRGATNCEPSGGASREGADAVGISGRFEFP